MRRSTRYLYNNEIVVLFFTTLMIMIKAPKSRRLISRQLKEFMEAASSINDNEAVFTDVLRMAEELTFCKHRGNSRRYYYNASEIDQVLGSYYISNKSFMTLVEAWKLFRSGRYLI